MNAERNTVEGHGFTGCEKTPSGNDFGWRSASSAAISLFSEPALAAGEFCRPKKHFFRSLLSRAVRTLRRRGSSRCGTAISRIFRALTDSLRRAIAC